MKVRELIEKLQGLDPDKQVLIDESAHCRKVSQVIDTYSGVVEDEEHTTLPVVYIMHGSTLTLRKCL